MLNEILGAAARFEEGLSRRFGLVGGAPSPQLTPEIAPVTVLPEGDERQLPSGVVLATAYIMQVAVAGVRSCVQLANPTGSNLLLNLTALELFTPDAAGYLTCGHANLGAIAGLPATGGVCYRDSRTRTNGGVYTRTPTGQVRRSDAAEPPTVPVANIFTRYVTQLVTTTWRGSILIAPGWCVMCAHQTANNGLAGAFEWAEVPIAVGEVGPF